MEFIVVDTIAFLALVVISGLIIYQLGNEK